MRLVGAVLLGIGAVMLFAGAAYVRDVAAALGLATTLDAVCGGAIEANPTSPGVFGAGVVAALGGAAIVVATARRRLLTALLVGLAIVASVVAGYAYERYAYAQARQAPPSGEYAWLNPPRDMPNFVLRNVDGGMTELRDLHGKAVLMFFGYTHCPDICPTTLADYKTIKRKLGPDAGNVAFVFVSVDGERDDPAFLKKYIGLFDKDFVALTAHPSVVASIERDFGGKFTIDKPASDASASAAEYKVSHTTDTYLLDSDGRWRAVLPLSMGPDEVVQQVQSVLAQD
jgi:protein SCO1/2